MFASALEAGVFKEDRGGPAVRPALKAFLFVRLGVAAQNRVRPVFDGVGAALKKLCKQYPVLAHNVHLLNQLPLLGLGPLFFGSACKDRVVPVPLVDLAPPETHIIILLADMGSLC